MHVSRVRALLCGAVLILPFAASGAPSAPATLSSLVDQAWLRSPAGRGMSAREAEIDAGRELSVSWLAGQPVVGLSQRSSRWSEQSGVRESEASLAAPLYLPGQRAARRKLADLAASEWQAQMARTRLELAGSVRTRLWDAAEAQALLEEKEGHLHHAQDLADEVRSRVMAGELARADGLLVDQEVKAAHVAVAQAKGQALASMAKLRALVGPTGGLPAEPEPLATTAQNPQLQAARATALRSESALRLAQASRSAPPTLSVSVRQERGAGMTEAQRALGVALQMPIGTAGRNRPEETAAQTQLAIAQAEAGQIEESTRIELELARAQVGAALEALTFARERVAAMREHLKLIDKAFKLGERGLADLLRSRALAHEAEVAQRQQEVALGRAHAQFNQASGVSP